MSYIHFTEKERYVISHMHMAGFSLRAIGRRLGRDHTSIMREIKRNRPTYADDAVYWYYATQPIAMLRRHKARSHCRQNHQPLVEYIEDKLRLDGSVKSFSLFCWQCLLKVRLPPPLRASVPVPVL